MFRSKHPIAQRRILVTGASSGIGQAIAEQLADCQARLLITARREDRLLELSSRLTARGAADVTTLPGDITDPQHRQLLRNKAEEHFGGIDVLVNNAGVGGLGTFASADETRLRRIMEVNFFAPVELIRTFLPLLRESDDGVIVNIGSVLGHCAVPNKSEYCASKFALHGITDALRMELAHEDIDVLLISPSTTKSEFFDQAMVSQGSATMNRHAMSSQQVAQATIRAIERGRREMILSWGGKILASADRLFPNLTSNLLQRFG